MNIIASWSGGKDSCLACHEALHQGHEIAALLNFISQEHKRCCFHGIEGKLMRLQADLIGIPIFQKEVSPDMQKYEEEFKAAVRELKHDLSIEGMVFGDIYLDEHREWVERVCKDLEVRPLEPLWGRPPADVARTFVHDEFRSVIISCKADLLGREFIGRSFDDSLIMELERRGVCPCGENGEFHTFVIDGPLFSRRIEITRCEPVLRKGFWQHWSLDIQQWEVRSK